MDDAKLNRWFQQAPQIALSLARNRNDLYPTTKVMPYAATAPDFMFSGFMNVQMSPFDEYPNDPGTKWRLNILNSKDFHTRFFVSLDGLRFQLSRVEAIFHTRDAKRQPLTAGLHELKDTPENKTNPDPELANSSFGQDGVTLGSLSEETCQDFVGFSGRVDVRVVMTGKMDNVRTLMKYLGNTDFCVQYYGELNPETMLIENPKGIFHYTARDHNVCWGPLDHLKSMIVASPPLQISPRNRSFGIPKSIKQKFMFGKFDPELMQDFMARRKIWMEDPEWDYLKLLNL